MGKTSKSTQTVSIPPQVLARYNAVNARASAAASRPFQQYGGEFVAPLTGTQRAGMSNINAAANQAQPYYAQAYGTLNQAQADTQPYFGAAGDAYGAGLGQGQDYLGAATSYAQQGGQAVNASDINGEAINKYMSPYLQNVLQGTAGLLNQQNQSAMSGQTGNAIRQSAFGGDRGGIAAANLQQQQRLADASIFSNLLNQGYNNALNTAVGQQGVNLAAQQANRTATQATADRMAALGQQGFNQFTTTGQNVQGLGKDIYGVGAQTSAAQAALGTGAQNAAIQGGQAQMSAGQVEQATQQAEDTARLNQFKEEQSYPFQVAKFEADIAANTGALSGSTTTTTKPGGFFSDARLKENVQKVGKTYDGQHIYRYNYKGDPTTQIGLIAQEVEHHHPDAVGSKNHYRTVDYDKATDDAADRGHFYAGGLASMGGGVSPMQAGQGYADGGLAGVDPAYMAELYRQLHEIAAGRGINGMRGIPNQDAQIRELITARGLQEKQGNDAADAVNAIESIGQLGDTVGAWKYGDKKAFGGEVEDLQAKKREEEAGLARAALEANKPEPAPTGLAAPVKSDINPIAPVKIDAPKGEIKFGEKTSPHRLPVASGSVEPTNSGSETIKDLGQIVKIASSVAGMMNQGGRIHRDMGGGMPYSSGDSIVPESSSQPRQLMTAQGDGGGGGGTGKAIGQIAGLASSLIPGGGIVKKGLGAIGKIFSDERMKENIRPIGELFDGQKVHSFNYKGDPRTQIGLIAQEVEHHRPHAVDHAKGMKTVDYHDATQHAMRRGHFAEGGMPEEEMEEGPPPVISPGLVGIHRKLNPLGAKMDNFSDRAAEDRYSDLWNLDEESKGLGAADASPPPAENMLRREPNAPKAEASKTETAKAGPPKAGASDTPYKPTEAGLTAPMEGAPLPTGIAQIARLIHAGEGTGQNPDSSAKGPYQFVDGTFVEQFRKNYPDRAKGMSKSQIINLKYGPEGASISSQMGPRFIADNAKTIQRGGHTPDAGNVYLAHFLGAGTALKVLNADPSAPISRLVKQDAIDANKILRNGATAGSVINWARGVMAKKERELSRQERAFGGLAGRDGYQDAGAVALTPEQIAEQERREEVQRQLVADLPIQTVAPTPGTRAVGLMPSMAVEPAKEKGLGALPTATAADLAQIGNSQSAPASKLAVTNGAIGRSTNLAGVPSIAPGLVGTKPNLQPTNGAIGSSSNIVGAKDATQRTPGLTLPPATPEQVAQLVNGKPVATPVAPKRGNIVDRIFGYDKSKPAYDPKTNNKFFQRLGHGETDAVLAALKGLAAMGTAPTENVGVALAAGIGAGADAFQGQRAFGIEERKTAAQEMQARATEQQAASGAIEAKAAWQNAMTQGATALKTWIDFAYGKIQGLDAVGKKDPELNSFYDQALTRMKQFNLSGEVPNTGIDIPGTAPAASAAGATAPLPDGAAATPPTEPKGPVTMGAIDWNADEKTLRNQAAAFIASGNTALGEQVLAYADSVYPPQAKGMEALEAGREGAAELTRLGETARVNNNALVILKQFEKAVDQLPEGFQGPFADQIVKSGAALNQIATAFGVPTFFDPSKIASAEDAQKSANRLRDALTAGFNGTAGSEVMEKFVGSSPSLLNTKEGAKRLISGVRQANKAVDAEYQFGINYKGNPRQRGVAFRTMYPPQYWVDRSKADFYFSSNKKLAEQIRAYPSLKFNIGNQTARQYFDTNYRSIGGAAGVLNLVNGM